MTTAATNRLTYAQTNEGSFMLRLDAMPKALRDAINYCPVGFDPLELIEAYGTGAPVATILEALNRVVTLGLQDEIAATTGVEPLGASLPRKPKEGR